MIKRMKKVFSLNIVVDRNLFQHLPMNYHILKISTTRAILNGIRIWENMYFNQNSIHRSLKRDLPVYGTFWPPEL